MQEWNYTLEITLSKALLFGWHLLSFCPLAAATTYTVTATSLTTHVGDPLPPLIFSISTYSGKYASLFVGRPSLSTSATSASPPGKYAIKIAAGSMRAVGRADNLRFVSGTLAVIPPDNIGAKLENGIAYPSAYFSGPAYAMINVKSNPIANLAGDCVTDDTVNLQSLLAWGRDSRKATVNVADTAVTATSGISFIGLGGVVQINGVIATIASVTDATHLTLTSGVLRSVNGATLRPGGNVVNTTSSGNIVTATSGPTFIGLAPKSQILINGTLHQIASVTDSSHLVTKEPLPNQTGVKAYAGPPASAWGRQMLQLYFPAGCYLVSNQMQVYGNYWTFVGQGAQSSYLRLAPNSQAFNTGQKAYLLNVPSNNFNQNFRELIHNMGFNVGPGNPQAEIVHWVANNMGSMRNVQIWCDDSKCLQGLGLEGAFAGPSLIKNVAIYGSHYGVQATGQQEYQVTIEGLTTEGQLTMAISNGSFKLPIRHWLSYNSVPALVSTGSLANTAILDSSITYKGAGLVTGLSNASGGTLYGRNVSCKGYKPCEIDAGASPTQGLRALPSEFWTGTAKTIFDGSTAPHSLKLPILETPTPTDPCTSTTCDWQELGADTITWADTVAHATSSALYLPPGTYPARVDVTISVPASVNYINFNAAQFDLTHSSRKLFLIVAANSSEPLIIDGCMYTNCFISHTSSRTLVVRDTNFGYQSASGAGDLFIEDGDLQSYNGSGNSGDGPTFYSGQNVWARDLDIEVGNPNDLRYNKFVCDGAKLWILGYKTEQDSPSVVLQNRCRAEIFGFFFYQLHLYPVPPDASPIHLKDSSIFATGFIFVNKPGYGAANWVREIRGQSSSSLPSPSVDTSQHLNMFYSHGAESSVR